MATRKRPWSTWEKNWLVWLLRAVSTSASPWNSAREAMLCPTRAQAVPSQFAAGHPTNADETLHGQ